MSRLSTPRPEQYLEQIQLAFALLESGSLHWIY